MTKQEHLKRLDDLILLEEGWNDGCPAMHPKSVEATRSIIEYLFPSWDDSVGIINIEWNLNGEDLDFDVLTNETVQVYRYNGEEFSYEEIVSFNDYPKLQAIIDKFTEGQL
jgi:hypothetical protein